MHNETVYTSFSKALEYTRLVCGSTYSILVYTQTIYNITSRSLVHSCLAYSFPFSAQVYLWTTYIIQSSTLFYFAFIALGPADLTGHLCTLNLIQRTEVKEYFWYKPYFRFFFLDNFSPLALLRTSTVSEKGYFSGFYCSFDLFHKSILYSCIEDRMDLSCND